ncbi:MAG: flagellar biosynthesis protein FlhF [Burkholderiales bacterium]
MNVKRFVGRNSREAMRKLRDTLGPDALVLANRPCAEGVELLGAVPEALNEIDRFAEAGAHESDDDAHEPRVAENGRSGRDTPVPPPMSTVSFQDYVRQRLRDRSRAPVASPEPVAPLAEPSAAPVRQRASAPQRAAAASSASTAGFGSAADSLGASLNAAAARRPTRPAGPPSREQAASPPRRHAGSPVPPIIGPAHSAEALVAELQALKGMITSQFEAMRWFDGVARDPIQGQMLRTMVESGFSLKLARSLVSHFPQDGTAAQASQWLSKVLARNLRCLPDSETFEAGGVYALIGPTGVGKTTTTAKLASRHVLKYGPQSVALITVDTYRLGAHDQLRAFGRILGVPVHIAHDAAALNDLLRLRTSRQLVLIDTVGMGHRDERIRNLLATLSREEIRHVVVASSAAQAETIDESLRAYQARKSHGVIFTKLDEAARIGGALDCAIRQKLPILGVCDGQRVPEDWQSPDPHKLVARALKASRPNWFGLEEETLPTLFGVASTLQSEAAHA